MRVVARTQRSLVESLSGRQYDRPDRFAAFEIAVGLCRLFQGIVLANGDLDSSVRD
jgi:hypothetical protein